MADISWQNGIDADALNFINTAGITDATQKSAIYALVFGLKAYGMWGIFDAIYPFIGGTATTHKYNLINPANYQLTFTGTWTHSASGAAPGVDGYADSGLVPSTVIPSANSNHLSVYVTQNNVGGGDSFDIGSFVSAGANLILSARDTGLGDNPDFKSNSANLLGTGTDARGFVLGARLTTNTLIIAKNGAVMNRIFTEAAGALPALSIYLGNINVDGAPYGIGYAQRNLAFASVGDAIDVDLQAKMYSVVQAYETTLTRNV